MKNQHIIDCYKLDLIKNVPKELELIADYRDHLFSENQKLKKILWALGICFASLLVFNIIKNYGKKKNTLKRDYIMWIKQNINPIRKIALKKPTFLEKPMVKL